MQVHIAKKIYFANKPNRLKKKTLLTDRCKVVAVVNGASLSRSSKYGGKSRHSPSVPEVVAGVHFRNFLQVS